MSKLTYGLLGAGLLLAAGSLIVGWFVFPAVIQSKITKTVRLEEGGDTWKKWENIPIPIYYKIYIFNITNPEAVKSGEKPIFQEVGPFVYQQKRVKTNITVNLDDDTVSYRQKVFYFFRPDMTQGSLDDEVWILNMPYIGLTTKAVRDGGVARSVIQDLFHQEFPDIEPIYKVTVDEFLFKGQYLPFIESLAATKGEMLLPNHTFGVQYNKNGSDTGLFEVYSGVQDNTKFGSIASWNNESSVSYWNDEYCNMINGSDGSLFAPFVTKDRVLPIFSSDLCRSLYLTYNGEETVRGLTGYRFTLPENLLEDPRINKENECFCTYRGGDDFRACPKRGAYQVESCKKGFPIVISMPHFLDAADEMREACEGLHPDREKHETSITLEPNTGVLLKANKRIQFNMEVAPTKKFKKSKKLPEMIFPIFWVDESAELTEASAERIQSKLIKPQQVVGSAMWGIFGVGCVLIILGVVLIIRHNRRNTGEKNFH